MKGLKELLMSTEEQREDEIHKLIKKGKEMVKIRCGKPKIQKDCKGFFSRNVNVPYLHE